jgi:1-acyl-sn-glycerol-3-phosphate acyltransferase
MRSGKALRGFDRLSYARSLLITAPLIFIATGLMGTISLACSFVDASGALQDRCAKMWSRLVLTICGVKVRVEGVEQLQPGTTYVFCANHQSQIDTPVVLAALPFPFRFAAKKELFAIPFLGWHLRRSGHIPIDRQNPHAAVKSFRGAGERLRRGVSVLFFPEGGTSLGGGIGKFKRGGFALARQWEAQIVPVTLRGSRHVLRPKSYHVRAGTVDVLIGPPISPDGGAAAELASQVREKIVETFENGKTLDRHTHAHSR